jgi:hypothetical protein
VMVNDDPSTAQDILRAVMSVTKSCYCMRIGEAFVTGLLAAATWIGPSIHVFVRT